THVDPRPPSHTSPTPTCCFLLIIPPPPRSTLFPYTTLFRSRRRTHPARPSRLGGHCRRPAARRGLQSAGQRQDDRGRAARRPRRSEEHTSELQSLTNLVCRLLLEKKKQHTTPPQYHYTVTPL